MSALSSIDITIIVISLAIVMAVGFWASRRKSEAAADYFLASRRLPWFLIGTSFVSTSVSSEQIVGTVGAAYEHGMKIANGELWSLPAYTLLVCVFIPIYLKNRITTIPDFLTRRYGPLCADLYSWIMLFAYVFIFMVAVLYGGSLAFAELTGLNRHVILWAIVILVGAYTVKGGLASVVWTDAAQCIMLLGGGIVLFFIALSQLPGGLWEAWESMRQAHPERFHLYQPPDDQTVPFLGLIISTFGLALFYQAGNQVMIQRVLAARSTWDGVMGIVFAGILNFLRPLVTCFLGFIVYHWISVMHQAEPLAKQDHAFSFALKVFAPEWGLRGIVLAGFLAAVMSTISSQVNSIATIFSFDVYKRLSPAPVSDRRLVIVGQLASILALIVAAACSPIVGRLGGIFLYFQQAVTYLATPFASVILMGVIWKRANYPSATFGILGGLVIQTAVVLSFVLANAGVQTWLASQSDSIGSALVLLQSIPSVGEVTFIQAPNWLYLGFIGQVINIGGIVLVARMTQPPSETQWRPFLWTPALVRGYDRANTHWYTRFWLWFSVYAVIWCAIYIWLW